MRRFIHKNIKRNIIFFLIMCITALPFALFSGCTPIDKDYAASSYSADSATISYPEDIVIPTIKSSDTVMPIYFDISLYDEENYSQIYLGKSYKYKAKYEGVSINVPTKLSVLNKKGWEIIEKQRYTSVSSIKAGVTAEIKLVNKNGKLLTAYFYNESTTSVKLTDCKIVRLAVDENFEITKSPDYGSFSINGINNNSAITDVFRALGAPSHFHADSKSDYTLNWFKSASDRRNKITVKINIDNDCVTYIAISNYK